MFKFGEEINKKTVRNLAEETVGKEAALSDPVTAWFAKVISDEKTARKLQCVKLVISDVDGCLTDSTVLFSDSGTESKSFSVVDGFGVVRSMRTGIKIAFLSGRYNRSTELRAKTLGIPQDMCFIGFSETKQKKLVEIIEKNSVKKEEVLLLGDDFLDLECADLVGTFAAPASSLFYVKYYADLVVPAVGGSMVLRLLLDLINFLRGDHYAQEKIEDLLAAYNSKFKSPEN